MEFGGSDRGTGMVFNVAEVTIVSLKKSVMNVKVLCFMVKAKTSFQLKCLII